MSPLSKKRKADEFESDDRKSVPFLPDDLVHMIFGELATEERDPLGSSCRRFREIDFELGKRIYNEIWIELLRTYKSMCITGCTHKSKYIIDINKKNSAPDQQLNHHQRVFRRASTNLLLIRIDRGKKFSDSAYYRYIGSFMEKVQFKRLKISINCDQAGNEFLLSMFNNKNIRHNQMFLNFWNTKPASREDLSRTRALLMQLPKMDKFKVDWGRQLRDRAKLDYLQLIDDNTLLHIVKNTRHVELEHAACSAQGMLNAIQVICSSKENCSYIEFETPYPSISELFRLFNPTFGGDLTAGIGFYYTDPQSQSMLHICATSATVSGNAVITMAKLSSRKEVIDWCD